MGADAQGQRHHAKGGRHDHDDDDAERYRQVLPDDGAGAPAQALRREKILDSVMHQDDLGLLERGVAAPGAHGDAHIGCGKTRGIVDPVAHHGDFVPRFAQRLDRGNLVLGRKPGTHLIEPEFAPDRLGGVRSVAGEHDRADASRFEGRQDCAGFGANLVLQQHPPDKVPADHPHFRELRRGRGQSFRPFGQGARLQKLPAAQKQRRAAQAGAQPLTGERLKVVHLHGPDTLRLGMPDDRARDRMLRF